PSPLARESAKRLPGTLPVRCVVREQDGLHVKFCEATDGFAGQRHVVREKCVREGDLPLHALQEVADDDEPIARRVEADTPGGVTRRVEDANTAQDGELLAFFD